MNFSECLSKVATDRLRGARKLWSTDEWYARVDRISGRWLQYVVYLDGRSFGLPGPLPIEVEEGFGPIVLVTVSADRLGGGADLVTYSPPAEDMLATDWEIVDDARVAAVLKNIQEPLR